MLKYAFLKVYVSVLLVITQCWSYYIWKRFIYITNETILAFAVFIEFERNGSRKKTRVDLRNGIVSKSDESISVFLVHFHLYYNTKPFC